MELQPSFVQKNSLQTIPLGGSKPIRLQGAFRYLVRYLFGTASTQLRKFPNKYRTTHGYVSNGAASNAGEIL